jgi:multiple sugar transport system ATP-binding protein
MPTSVTFDQATRIYPGMTTPAVSALDLEVRPGEFLVLVGPSGSGKSTALRMLAGLEDVNQGRILIGDKDVTHLRPKDRDIAMVFQNYALYPHMSVAENMGFALKIAGSPKADIEARVLEAAKILDLVDYLDRKPKALSGGQRQRVAMGRAIVRQPQVFLMEALPAISRTVSSSPDAYVYLAESIRAWPDQRGLADLIATAGWTAPQWRNLSGGVVALHRATA